MASNSIESESSSNQRVKNERNNPSLFKSFVAGGFGGVCLIFAGHPLDTIKVRLQTQPHTPDGKPTLYNGTWDCAKKIVQRERVKGLYKGMAAPIAGVAPMYALCFFAFGVGKKLQNKADDEELTPKELFLAGTVAGLATTAVMAPGERIKCLLQVQDANPDHKGPRKYNGAMDCCKKLYREGGIRNVYVGTLATACRDIPATGMYFMVYETMKRKLSSDGKGTNLSVFNTLMAGGTAGILNWIVAIPADVLKSRQQTAPPGTYSGMLDVFKKTIAADGLSGMYKGAAPVLIRAFPANAACFLGFECMMKLLNLLDGTG